MLGSDWASMSITCMMVQTDGSRSHYTRVTLIYLIKADLFKGDLMNTNFIHVMEANTRDTHTRPIRA